jgi:hypothetical protein
VNGTSRILSVTIKNAPKLELVIDGKSQFLFAFQDATLKEIRTMAKLEASYRFFYENLVI